MTYLCVCVSVCFCVYLYVIAGVHTCGGHRSSVSFLKGWSLFWGGGGGQGLSLSSNLLRRLEWLARNPRVSTSPVLGLWMYIHHAQLFSCGFWNSNVVVPPPIDWSKWTKWFAFFSSNAISDLIHKMWIFTKVKNVKV